MKLLNKIFINRFVAHKNVSMIIPNLTLKEHYLLNELTDEVLVDLIVTTQDSSFFKVLYERYVQMVFKKCKSFSKNSQEAEDLCQDIFIKLMGKIESFNGSSKFSTWLYAFTFNHCVNYHQRNKFNKFEKIAYNIDLICDDVISQSNEENFSQLLKLEKLKEAMNLIPVHEKQILILKYQEFKSIKELVVFYNVGESAIKMRLKRAKEKLLTVYNNYQYEAAI